MSEQIRREFTLSFPVDKIKQAIEDACRTSTGSYQIKDRNAVFNSYSVSLVKMLSVLPITIQLKKVSETETLIDLSAVTGPQLSKSPTFVSQMIDEFLKKVGDFVSGKLIVNTTPPKSATIDDPPRQQNVGKTFLLLIVVIGMIGALIYWMSR